MFQSVNRSYLATNTWASKVLSTFVLFGGKSLDLPSASISSARVWIK
jgi:hypothetical protein